MIATDGSDEAVVASRRALDLLREDVEVVLVTVIPHYESPLETAGGIVGPTITEEEAAEEWAGNVELGRRALARTDEAIDQSVTIRLVAGDVKAGHQIVRAAGDIGADLIVVGSSGKGFLARVFTSSVSDDVVHHAPCPVLVVPYEQA